MPQDRGLYAWFFKEVPPGVPTDGCITKDGLTLLYVGICPKNDKVKKNRNLRTRIKGEHFKGNADGSTLRQTLGVLLTEQSDFPLRRVGSGKRITLTHLGEQWLDDWMEENAFVCWVKHPAPWEVEKEIIENVSLPLNIRDNDHPFAKQLSAMRSEAKRVAKEMPIANEDNQQRKKKSKGDDNSKLEKTDVGRSFKTQISAQIGESIVVAELGRHDIVATAFAGNVPDIDILAYANGKSVPLQVKAQKTGNPGVDAEKYLNIHFVLPPYN